MARVTEVPEAQPAVVGAKRIESLGWLTESSIMPKKQRVIEGVGASSIVELKAQLYQTQEEAKRVKEGTLNPEELRSRKERGINVGDIMAKRNSGVDARNERDKLQLRPTGEVDTYAALERKAELYNKLVRGELPDQEEKELYNVDFFKKGETLQDEEKHLRVEEGGEERSGLDWRDSGPGGLESDDMRMERARQQWENESKQTMAEEVEELAKRQERKQAIAEVNRETNTAREKSLLLKQQRQAEAAKTRERLKAAFLKKQAEKLRAATKGGNITKQSGMEK